MEEYFTSNTPTDLQEFVLQVDKLVTALSDEYSSITIFNDENPLDAPSSTTHCFTTPNAVRDAVLHGNAKKSAGTDGISNFIVRRLPLMALTLLRW